MLSLLYKLLFAILATAYPHSTSALDSSSFRERHDARLTLERAGWLAYPALCGEAKTVEGERLREELLSRLCGWRAMAARAWLRADDCTLEANVDAVAALVTYVRIPLEDGHCEVYRYNAANWMRSAPFHTKQGVAGEVRLLLEAIVR